LFMIGTKLSCHETASLGKLLYVSNSIYRFFTFIVA
jgi:hypothetical protein